MPSSAGSPAFRGAQPTSSSSSPFYLGGGKDSLLHGKPAFHGLMQLPEQHQQGSNGLLNLGFFSGATSGQDARLVFPDQFNAGSAAGNSSELAGIFSGNLMAGGAAGFSSALYTNSSETTAPPQMLATALLQKAT
jgi:hypothetical protein